MSRQGSRPPGEVLSGVLNVAKPAGLTSHDVVARVRRLAGQRRVGHAGTLDPLATGVLVVCLGQATRIVEYLAELLKTYEATVHFGVITDTWDAEGAVVERHDAGHLTRETIEGLLPQFTGRIMQVPPMYSALKRHGQPLYRLARRGLTVGRTPRSVDVHRLEILTWEPPRLTVLVQCSKGTYVRALAHDLGKAAGPGAHLAALSRTAIGHLRVEDSVSMETLEDDGIALHLIEVPMALAHLRQVVVSEETAQRIGYGQAVSLEVAPGAEPLAVVDRDGDLVAVLRWTGAAAQWRPAKVFKTSG